MSAPPITREETATGAFAALANKVFARYLTVLTMSLAGNWIRVTARGISSTTLRATRLSWG